MSHRYVKKRKSQFSYVIHNNGKSKKVTKSFKPNLPSTSNDLDQKEDTTENANAALIVDYAQTAVVEVNLTPSEEASSSPPDPKRKSSLH